MGKFRPRLTFANVTSALALFVALGGGAYAATQLPKNSVGTKQLKNGAVTGAKLHDKAIVGTKVADHSLTGRQIKSATLGLVPRASHADTAANAARAGNGARRIDFQPSSVADPEPASYLSPGAHTLLSLHGLTVTASCVPHGGNAEAYVAFTSSVDASVDWSFVHFDNPGKVPEVSGTTLEPPSYPTQQVAGRQGDNVFETGQWVYRSATHTFTLVMTVGTAAGGCYVRGTAVSAP